MLLARGAADADLIPISPARTFVRGFVVQAGNPKALVFFIALLPQFIDPARSVPAQALILGASSVAIELIALIAYAMGAVQAGRLAGARISAAIERVGGGLLIAAGARLASESCE